MWMGPKLLNEIFFFFFFCSGPNEPRGKPGRQPAKPDLVIALKHLCQTSAVSNYSTVGLSQDFLCTSWIIQPIRCVYLRMHAGVTPGHCTCRVRASPLAWWLRLARSPPLLFHRRSCGLTGSLCGLIALFFTGPSFVFNLWTATLHKLRYTAAAATWLPPVDAMLAL